MAMCAFCVCQFVGKKQTSRTPSREPTDAFAEIITGFNTLPKSLAIGSG